MADIIGIFGGSDIINVFGSFIPDFNTFNSFSKFSILLALASVFDI